MNTIVKFHPERIRSKAALTFAIAAIGLLFTGWASPPVFSSVNALQSSNASCGLVPSLTTATNVKTQAEQAFPSLHGDLSRHSLGNKSVSADMEVVEFQFNPSSFAPGEHPTYVYHKTKNNGPGTIPQDIQLRSTYYISRNSTFGDSDDISIGTYITYSPSGGTPSGYYMTYTGCTEHLALITIPSDASGQYYVFIYRQFESVTCSDPNMANNHLLRSGTITVSGGEGPGTLQFSASSYTVKENGGSVSLSVTRSGGSDGAASVNYATADGTAIAGLDYTSKSGTLNWSDGDSASKTITVSITDDSYDEYYGETFTVGLSVAHGANLGSPSSATVRIVDEKHGWLQFSASSYTVNENGGSVSLSVTRSGGSDGAASVNYATADGTAIAGLDYTSKSGTLNWSDGDSASKTITVSITDDSYYESSETFTVGLSVAHGANLGSPSKATVTIADNDLSANISLLSGFCDLYVSNMIQFSAEVTGAQGTLSYQWDLDGNGTFNDSTSRQPSYQYSTEGTRLVQVVVQDGVETASAGKFIAIGKAPVSGERNSAIAPDPKAGQTLNPITRQAFEFESAKKDKGLIIIAHGMNESASKQWIYDMASAIINKLSDNCPNVCAWDWQERAKTDICHVRQQGIAQGYNVAQWVKNNISSNNINPSKPIHIIGFSAGGHVAGTCAGNIPRYINQISLLDTPALCFGVYSTYFPLGGKADCYVSLIGGIYSYKHQTHWTPLLFSFSHGYAHDWYTATIGNSDHDGFWYSPWSNNPFPFSMQMKTAYGMPFSTMATPTEGFDTFGSVSLSDGVYTITEGAGNVGIYKTMTFPAGAQHLFFKYQFSSPGDGDFLAVSMGTNELLYVGEDLPLAREDYVDGEASITNYAGQSAELIFKLISRGSPNAQLKIKSIQIVSPILHYLAADFDGDHLADPAAVDSSGDWYVWFSGSGYTLGGPYSLGQADFTPLAGDFDGDGLADPAVADNNIGWSAGRTWYAWLSSMNYQVGHLTLYGFMCAPVTGKPLVSDFDGDLKADICVHVAGDDWYRWMSGENYACRDTFGIDADPSDCVESTAGDIDGDGLADFAMISSAGNWYVWFSSNNYHLNGPYALGVYGTPILADFDGDQKADPAVVDSIGNWYVWFSASGYVSGGPYTLSVP